MKPAFFPLSRLRALGLLCVACFLALPGAAWAATATATLSSPSAEVGGRLELKIAVEGGEKAEPPKIAVDGLDIRYVGVSTQVQINNFTATRIEAFTYLVTPRKDGDFTIPAVKIGTGGAAASTQPLRLAVAPAGKGGGKTAGAANETFAIAEWVLPKTSAYVGESVPVELRLYVDARVDCRLPQLPAIAGEGFAIQKIGKPVQKRVTKDGREWELVIFRTALTPAKAGKLALPATDINAIVTVQPKRSRIDDFERGFPDPFNMFPQQRQAVIRPDPVELEIKQLPAEGRPKEFSGAVGQFAMEPPKALPDHVRVGDPVTLTCVVRGLGNFDRVEAPVLANASGWHLYPPSAKFKADDDVGISGEKTFEQALIPETPGAELPLAKFAYFNPSTERYETLTGKPLPVAVEGTPAAPAVPAPSAVAASTPAPAPAVRDIQYLRLDPGKRVSGFAPVWRTPVFWELQAVPLAALLAFGGWSLRRCRLADSRARRAAQLRQARAEAGRVLSDPDANPSDFYSAAIRALQLETALVTGGDPAVFDAEAILASRPLDCETAEGVRRLFAAHDELRYAGVGAGVGATVYPDQRARVLEILAAFEKSHV